MTRPEKLQTIRANPAVSVLIMGENGWLISRRLCLS